ncbi:MAG: hypothetical protein ACRDU9_11060 [Acidimicrobiia bacterium]
MEYGIMIYVIYAAVAVAMTALLARTLFKAGAVFLDDVFEGRPRLAEAVNRLLVVGFYMLNLGYGLFLLRAEPQETAFDAVAYLVNRLAILLVTLGVIHFVNVFVFWSIRHRVELKTAPPPLPPQIFVPEDLSHDTP